jgi:SAM-dependent methyltransferase
MPEYREIAVEAEFSYYRDDLALVHDTGFGFHGNRCAPGILELLEPVRRRGGVVLELGCGSGSLTRHLLGAGHRVIATDGSPAMLARARARLPEADLRRLVLPGDRLPAVDAVVGVGHVLNYLGDEESVTRAVAAIADALRPGGVLAIDVIDIAWPDDWRNMASLARVNAEWAVFSRSVATTHRRMVQEVTTFVRSADASWRRSDERHENVLLDVTGLVAVLEQHGMTAGTRTSFGGERLPTGLLALVGHAR